MSRTSRGCRRTACLSGGYILAFHGIEWVTVGHFRALAAGMWEPSAARASRGRNPCTARDAPRAR